MVELRTLATIFLVPSSYSLLMAKSIQVSKALWKKLKTLSIEQERPISHIAEEILREEIEVGE